FFRSLLPLPPRATLFPYTTLFRSGSRGFGTVRVRARPCRACANHCYVGTALERGGSRPQADRAGYSGQKTPAVSVAHYCTGNIRSEEHTSELQSRENLVCRLLLEK